MTDGNNRHLHYASRGSDVNARSRHSNKSLTFLVQMPPFQDRFTSTSEVPIWLSLPATAKRLAESTNPARYTPSSSLHVT